MTYDFNLTNFCLLPLWYNRICIKHLVIYKMIPLLRDNDSVRSFDKKDRK